jgi:cytochrome c1
MAPPLYDEAVEYTDGTPATLEQLAHDIAAFLKWTAQPELEARKALGIKVLLFLIFLTVMLYAVKRKIWRDIEH